MEKAGDFSNHTDGPETTDGVESFPSSPFPAWVPAVTVAVSMLIFLAGSFYYRHRKVIKKRKIFMDYFYIIFQYGGMRRKRMVAALCNTNAITLRELGRSFMISFDSLANADNSCPFYPDDSAFTGGRHHSSPITPAAQKKSFFRNRGMTTTKKYRGPFIRINTQPEENPQQSTVSFQDIVMKFKTKRPNSNVASAQSTPNRRSMLSPQYEGSSMCTIHGDDFDYQKHKEEDDFAAHYNRQRRNAYVVQYDGPTGRGPEGALDVGRHSLGHIMPEHFCGQHSPYSGKRNSEPFPHLHDHNCEHSLGQCQQSCIFQVPGDLLSPANVVCGSHGFIPIAHEQNSPGQQYRNSEPTILIHSPSTDGETPQGWNDIRSRNTNGIVFLKRVPKTDGPPGVFYYEDQRTPSPDRAGRASLSKVSYVPSGNMNEYYNCFHSTIKQKKSNEDLSIKKNTGRIHSPRPRHLTSKSKRSRLSLGDLAISNFNRRIDFSSQSLQDQDSDQPTDSKGSQDSSRSTSRTTWTRLKNVFSGSRAAQSFHSQVKVSKSLPVKQDRQRRRRNRRSTSWQKFVSVFTGFRSLPETKKSASMDIPRASSSFPLGLDIHISKCGDNLDTFDLESDTDNGYPENIRPWISESSRHTDSLGTGRSTYEKMSSNEDSDSALRGCGRPTTLHMPVKTNSFPEELIHGRRYFKRVKTVFDASRSMQNKTSQPSRTLVRRYRKRNDKVVASSMSLPQSQKDFSCYAFQAAYSPFKDEYRFIGCSDLTDGKPQVVTPNRLEVDDSEVPSSSRCYRSPSPLPERLQALLKEGRHYALKSEAGLDSGSNKSLYWTPPPETDKMFIYQDLESYSNYRDGLIVSEESLQPQAVHDYAVNSTPVNFSHHNSLRTNLNPFNVNALASASDSPGQNSEIDFNNLTSTKREDNYENSSTITNSNATFCSGDKLPQRCLLTLDRKLIGASNESLYYDTVSALGSPSPTENRHILHVGRSSSEFVLNSPDPKCVPIQELRGGAENIKEFSSADLDISNTSPLHKNASNNSSLDTTTPTCSLPINRVKSTPLLSVDSLLKKSSSKKHLLLTYCSSHLSNDMTSTSMPVFGSHQSQCLFIPAQASCGRQHPHTDSYSYSLCKPTKPVRRHSSPSPLNKRSTSRRSACNTPAMAGTTTATRLTHGARSSCLPAHHFMTLVEHGTYDAQSEHAGENNIEQSIPASGLSSTTSKSRDSVDGAVYVDMSPNDTLI